MSAATRSRALQKMSEQWFAQTALRKSADSYVQYLTERGYAARTVKVYFQSVAHFCNWSARQQTDLAHLSEALIDRFVDRHLPKCRCAPRCVHARGTVHAALIRFLGMLRDNGQCARPSSRVPDAIDRELADFDRYLIEVRGVSVTTRATRLRHLRDFLIDQFGTRAVNLNTLRPEDIAHFMRRYTAGWAPASINAAGISLRIYFSFKASCGVPTTTLIAALPCIAQWRLAGLPQVLSTQEIERLLRAFDRRQATGKRDYAITRCLLDLGLRRTEVARLQLDDVDWKAATLRIHAKGTRIDVLPLPASTGEAIAEYLQKGRPRTTRREIFVRHRPPLNAAAGPDIVRNAVRCAAERCGLEHRIRGTHVFRHTVAGRLVQGGAPFKQIADLLRHRSLDTTTIYAKVDLPALRQVALPWAGRSR
jgi:site-specific recombinase XerD